MADDWGPLGALAGDGHGEGGFDAAFSHWRDAVRGTPYLENCNDRNTLRRVG